MKDNPQEEKILKEAGYSKTLINYDKSGALNKVRKAISLAFQAGHDVGRKDYGLELKQTFQDGIGVGLKQAKSQTLDEIKKVIEELDWNGISFEEEIGLDGCGTGHFYPNKQELLTKIRGMK